MGKLKLIARTMPERQFSCPTGNSFWPSNEGPPRDMKLALCRRSWCHQATAEHEVVASVSVSEARCPAPRRHEWVSVQARAIGRLDRSGAVIVRVDLERVEAFQWRALIVAFS